MVDDNEAKSGRKLNTDSETEIDKKIKLALSELRNESKNKTLSLSDGFSIIASVFGIASASVAMMNNNDTVIILFSDQKIVPQKEEGKTLAVQLSDELVKKNKKFDIKQFLALPLTDIPEILSEEQLSILLGDLEKESSSLSIDLDQTRNASLLSECRVDSGLSKLDTNSENLKMDPLMCMALCSGLTMFNFNPVDRKPWVRTKPKKPAKSDADE